MQNPDVTYSRRGDRERRRARIRKFLLLGGLIGAVALLGADRERVATAAAAPVLEEDRVAQVYAELATVKGELDLALAQIERANAIMKYSTRYKITADLAAAIHDIAVAEGLEPDLGFRIVRAESEFKERATSPVGAVGLAQVMPSTARDHHGGALPAGDQPPHWLQVPSRPHQGLQGRREAGRPGVQPRPGDREQCTRPGSGPPERLRTHGAAWL
jgi:hypothetical protein